MKKIFICTRYSVLNKSKSGTILASKSLDIKEYSEKLFSDNRLESKLNAFKAIAFRSLMEQKISPDVSGSIEIHWVLAISDLLPDNHRSQLLSLAEKLKKENNIKMHVLDVESGLVPVRKGGFTGDFIGLFDSFIKNENSDLDDCLYASVRLDDDDGLSNNYINQLAKYLKKDFSGFVISFPFGYQGVFDGNKINNLKDIYVDKIALGLAHINYCEKGNYLDEIINIYGLGNHQMIDNFRPVIMDSRNHSYLRVLSLFNDSGANSWHSDLREASIDTDDNNNFSFFIDEKIKSSLPLRNKRSIFNDCNPWIVGLNKQLKDARLKIRKIKDLLMNN